MANIADYVTTIRNDVASIARPLYEAMCPYARKAAWVATYPVLGNVSQKLKLQLEDRLATPDSRSHWMWNASFNSATATKVTLITNPLAYASVAAAYGAEWKTALWWGIGESVARAIIGLASEGEQMKTELNLGLGIRQEKYGGLPGNVRRAKSLVLVGSLAGRVASLPVEYALSVMARTDRSAPEGRGAEDS